MWVLLDSGIWVNLDYVCSIVRSNDGTAKAYLGNARPDEFFPLTARDMQRIHERLLNADQR